MSHRTVEFNFRSTRTANRDVDVKCRSSIFFSTRSVHRRQHVSAHVSAEEALVLFEIKTSFAVAFTFITIRVCVIAATGLIASPPVTVRVVLRSWDTMDEPCYDHCVWPRGGGIHRTGRSIIPPPGEPAGIRGSCAGNAPPRFVSRFTEPENGHYPDKFIYFAIRIKFYPLFTLFIIRAIHYLLTHRGQKKFAGLTNSFSSVHMSEVNLSFKK